jgi:hypothetical protein
LGIVLERAFIVRIVLSVMIIAPPNRHGFKLVSSAISAISTLSSAIPEFHRIRLNSLLLSLADDGILPISTDPIQSIGKTLGAERLASLDSKRDQAHQRLNKKQMKEWNPTITYQKGEYILIRRVQKLKIKSQWYEKPYKIHRVHENNTYDLIDDEGNFFRSALYADRLKQYQPR